MVCVVKNRFLFLSGLLLSQCNFIIQTLRNWLLKNLSNFISWNTEGLHRCDPIINTEFTFFLFDNFFKFFDRFIIRMLPSVVFNLNNFSETFVLWEFSINSFEIQLMEFEDLQKSFHAKFIPPIILFHDAENSSENVSDITSTTNIRWKGSIRNGNKTSSSVIKNNVKLFNWLNCFSDFIHWISNLVSNLLPGLFNIINFVNIQSARVWSEL